MERGHRHVKLEVFTKSKRFRGGANSSAFGTSGTTMLVTTDTAKVVLEINGQRVWTVSIAEIAAQATAICCAAFTQCRKNMMRHRLFLVRRFFFWRCEGSCKILNGQRCSN